jgi:DNA-binding transcriptional LysR family regulator
LELRHLRYFVVLAEELHFGRAAQRLDLTQPPLSLNIRQLEDQLGVTLFARNRKTVTLTSAGRTFLAEARNILERSGHAREVVAAVREGRRGWLSIGFSGSMTYAGVPQLVAAYNRRYPDVELKLLEGSGYQQFEALLDGRLQAGFVDIANPPAEFGHLLLCDEPFVSCLPDNHRLAGKAEIAVSDLAEDEFIMFTRESEPANYDRILAICIEAGFEPKISNYAQQWLSVIALVASGLGIAIVPKRIAQTGITGVRFAPITASPMSRSCGYLVWEQNRLTEELSALIALVQGSVDVQTSKTNPN